MSVSRFDCVKRPYSVPDSPMPGTEVRPRLSNKTSNQSELKEDQLEERFKLSSSPDSSNTRFNASDSGEIHDSQVKVSKANAVNACDPLVKVFHENDANHDEMRLDKFGRNAPPSEAKAALPFESFGQADQSNPQNAGFSKKSVSPNHYNPGDGQLNSEEAKKERLRMKWREIRKRKKDSLESLKATRLKLEADNKALKKERLQLESLYTRAIITVAQAELDQGGSRYSGFTSTMVPLTPPWMNVTATQGVGAHSNNNAPIPTPFCLARHPQAAHPFTPWPTPSLLHSIGSDSFSAGTASHRGSLGAPLNAFHNQTNAYPPPPSGGLSCRHHPAASDMLAILQNQLVRQPGSEEELLLRMLEGQNHHTSSAVLGNRVTQLAQVVMPIIGYTSGLRGQAITNSPHSSLAEILLSLREGEQDAQLRARKISNYNERSGPGS